MASKGLGGMLKEMGLKPSQAVRVLDSFLEKLKEDAKAEKPLWALTAFETDEDGDIIDEATNELFLYESRECALIEVRRRAETEENPNIFYDVVETDPDEDDDASDEPEEEEDPDEDGDEPDPN